MATADRKARLHSWLLLALCAAILRGWPATGRCLGTLAAQEPPLQGAELAEEWRQQRRLLLAPLGQEGPIHYSRLRSRACLNAPLSTRYAQPPLEATKAIPWNPRPGKYLLQTCMFGQLSNQLLCTESYFMYAALLNRTLVIPPHSFNSQVLTTGKVARFDWSWDLALDVPHARACTGGGDTVITLAELKARLGGANVTVGATLCMHPDCLGHRQWGRAAAAMGISFPPAPAPFPYDMNSPLGDVLAYFAGHPAGDVPVLSMGDLYMIGLKGQNRFQVNRRFKAINSTCNVYLQPAAAVRQAGEGLVRHVFGGGNFVALHFRREDFCTQYATYRSYPPIADVAGALADYLASVNTSRIYIATNAHESEMSLLRKLLEAYVPPPAAVPDIMTLPRIDSVPGAREWAADWLRLGLDDNPFAPAMVEKLVCIAAAQFLGAPRSTFTLDIQNRRLAEGRATCADGDLALPSYELPAFVI